MEPERAISFSQESFLGVRCSDVSVDDLQFARQQPSWRGAASLPSLSFSAEFGKVDAFVSHTWNDNHEQRHAALTEWAESFRAREGREPIIWIDKACLNW